MSLRCHFDADGWLQGPVAITHLLTPNRYDSGFAEHGQGVVMHTEDGYEAGTVATFMNPAAQVSAFFSISTSGAIHQYLPVGHGYCAWTQAAGNQAWRGIECEDFTHPSLPLTPAQVIAFAQILEACSAYDGFPLQVTDDVNGTGLGWHGMGGQDWGGHLSCPGDVRKAQRPQIIALAMAIRSGAAPAPAPKPAPSPVPAWQEAILNKLPVLSEGAVDEAGHVFWVHRMTALIKAYGEITGMADVASQPIAGTFDAFAAANVRAVQAHAGIAADSVVGPQTWGVLVAGSPS